MNMYGAEFDQSMVKVDHIDVDVFPNPYTHTFPTEFPVDGPPSYPPHSDFAGFQHQHQHQQLYSPDTGCFIEPLDLPRRSHPEFAHHHPAYPQVPIPDINPSGSASSHDGESDDEEEDADVDTSAMTKEQLRKHKNRQSAARSRKRSRNRMGQLETMVQQLMAKNRRLEEQVRALLAEREATVRHHQQQHQMQQQSSYYH